jgi:Peptidase family M23
MGKEKFVFNRHTLTYEKVVTTVKEKVIKVFGFLSAAFVSGLIMLYLLYTFFPSPREKTLLLEIDQLKNQYAALDKQTELMNNVLNNVQHRDAGVHRVMFGMDPIDQGIWNGGVGGHDKYANLLGYKNSREAIINSTEKVEKLARQMTMQSKSLDTLQRLVAARENMFSSIPSIKPVREDKLNRGINLLSGFGKRLHPIHKVMKFHKGIDFSAPIGTAIQSTGDGVIVKVENNRSGYGKCVTISHGFGYQTLYGHMYRIDVKQGQRVKKGTQIGIVGNTGSSTGPHCHYEVHYKGQVVNPIQYCIDGLSPLEYQALVDAADAANQSFD